MLPLSPPWAAPFLAAIEAGLREAAATDDPAITEAALHLIQAGGKRLRPLISLAAARSLAADHVVPDPHDPVIQGAVAVELVHLASLYHDDVMDEATERRGVASVNARFGNLIAVVTGDFLLARAAGIAARLGQNVASVLADTLAAMCEGQVLEVSDAHHLDRDPQRYLAAIHGKTASLMGTAAHIPAIICQASPSRQAVLREAGTDIGLLFQLRDDLLDLVATREQLGKEPAQDLLEGIYTLPVISALTNPSVRARLIEHLQAASDPAHRAEAVALVREAGGIEATLDHMRRLLARLEANLATSPGESLAWLGSLGKGIVASAEAACTFTGVGH